MDYLQQEYVNFLDNEGTVTNMLMTMCQPFNQVVTYTLPSFDPQYLFTPQMTSAQRTSIFTDVAQQLMAKVLNISTTTHGYRNNQIYTALYKKQYTISIQEATTLI